MNNLEGLHRATFQSRYLIKKGQRRITPMAPRLGDQLLCVVKFGESDYLQQTSDGEFSVLDLATRQKAWFETPRGATPDQITAMIEGHFDAAAFRVTSNLWVVEC